MDRVRCRVRFLDIFFQQILQKIERHSVTKLVRAPEGRLGNTIDYRMANPAASARRNTEISGSGFYGVFGMVRPANYQQFTGTSETATYLRH